MSYFCGIDIWAWKGGAGTEHYSGGGVTANQNCLAYVCEDECGPSPVYASCSPSQCYQLMCLYINCNLHWASDMHFKKSASSFFVFASLWNVGSNIHKSALQLDEIASNLSWNQLPLGVLTSAEKSVLVKVYSQCVFWKLHFFKT